MKKIILPIMLTFFSSQLLANTAYIPEVTKSMVGAYSSRTCFSTTNISDVDVNVNFTFFDLNGVLYTSPIEGTVNISAIGQPTVLQPNQTASFCLPNNAPTYYGHGKIDVFAVDGISRSVLAVAHAKIGTYNSGLPTSALEVTINGGMPF
ncbi:hypothetical protein [Aeromonas hydrophila]|uniref:hypothetical protein n=1 Tax=Aeromonas hydrophila TaxID=644 RepID=UPI0035B873E2